MNSTKEYENAITAANTKDEVIEIIKNLPQITFTARIEQLREKYGIRSFSKIQADCGITKSLFYDIINGDRKSKKEHVIKIGIAMGLTVEELNELLKLANHKELYAKRKEDAAIIFGLTKKLKVEEIQNLLDDIGSKLDLMD